MNKKIIRYEDQWINFVGVYFFILENINIKLIELIRFDKNNPEEIEPFFFNLSVELNRIIPIEFNRKDKKKELSYSDGILLLSENLKFLPKDYEDLFERYKKQIVIINDIRNKYQHVPHYIRWTSYAGNTRIKQMHFINQKYDLITLSQISDREKQDIEKGIIKLEWEVNTLELIRIVECLNRIFIKIQKEFKKCILKNMISCDFPYANRILSIDFKCYNEKLQSISIPEGSNI